MANVVEEHTVLEEERPVTPTPSARLTFEQANKLAAGRPFELIGGRMAFKMPDYEHSRTQALLCIKLGNYFMANPIGQVFTELAHRLWPENPYEGRQPDLSVILNEHLKETGRYPTRPPDLAIEIISRDDTWTALFEKAALYLERGGREVWLVDPYQKGVMIVAAKTRLWESETVGSPELLPGFELELKDIFNWPGASKSSE